MAALLYATMARVSSRRRCFTFGSHEDNDRLSMRRAEEVMAWLADQGFDKSQMSAVGRGERDLRVATGDNVGNAANRRVEVIVR